MSKRAAALLIGGGALTAGAVWWASRRSGAVADATKDAVASGGTFAARLTGYWPYVESLSAKERLMEGAPMEATGYAARAKRKAGPLHTLEMHMADRTKHPFVSVACDYEIFPFGQRLIIDAWPDLIFRCVDTGGHFHGVGKLYRMLGREPLDICVDSSKTVVPKFASVKIALGDNFEGGKLVATSKFKDQTVTAGLVEARTAQDHDALSRAIESELGDRPREEQVAAAWVIRNRADAAGETIYALLCPHGAYGSPAKSGGYASTRKVSTDRARAIADEVLDAPASADPMGGAIDFWVPSRQAQMRAFGDIHRAAIAGGDLSKAARYERYAGYGTETEVRDQYARDGVRVVRVVGSVELLGRSA